MVLALNVFDRHAAPRRMLEEMAALLRPGGAAVLSVPLPITQHDAARWVPMLHSAPVDLGLSGRAQTWEAAVEELIKVVLAPAGWKVRAQPCQASALAWLIGLVCAGR